MEVVLGKLRIASRHQRQHQGARIGHVGCRVQPVLEEEKQAKDEAGDLAFGEEVHGQKKWDQPLQQRPSPQAERSPKPSEQVVTAFVYNEVRAVDEKKSAVRGEGVREESKIKD